MPTLALDHLSIPIDRVDFKADFYFSYNNKISQLMLMTKSLLIAQFLCLVEFLSCCFPEALDTNDILAFEALLS